MIKKNDLKTKYGDLLTDGCGKISFELAKEISEKLELNVIPSCF